MKHESTSPEFIWGFQCSLLGSKIHYLGQEKSNSLHGSTQVVNIHYLGQIHNLGQNRGTRQGDPLSAYLFILCLETLFLQIRENDNIKGIDIGDYQLKLSAFADDADFLMANVDTLQLVFQTCSTFQLYSSLKLNLEKSEACWIGNKMGSYEIPISCKWVNIKCNAMRTLGIFNSYEKDPEEKLNFLDILKSVNDVLMIWRSRGLSLSGRILIFKTLALSKLLYACTMKVSSKFLIDQLNALQKNSFGTTKAKN